LNGRADGCCVSDPSVEPPLEAEVQRALAEELESYGWRVIREVSFTPSRAHTSGNADDARNRRVDHYCVARQDIGGGPWAIRKGLVIAIECKRQSRFKAARNADLQVASVLSGHDFHIDKTPLARPQLCLYATPETLTAGTATRLCSNHFLAFLDRQMWSTGGAVLWRDDRGRLYFRQHIARQDRTRYLSPPRA